MLWRSGSSSIGASNAACDWTLSGQRPWPPTLSSSAPGWPSRRSNSIWPASGNFSTIWLPVASCRLTRPAQVRGPKYVVKRGKTPVLSAGQARQLLDSIDVTELSGLRDRALIGVMVYSFARVSAAATLRVEDYFENGKRAWLRLHEKGGKRHEVPCHHNLAAYLD